MYDHIVVTVTLLKPAFTSWSHFPCATWLAVFQVLTNEASPTNFKGFLTFKCSLINCSVVGALGDNNLVRHISRYMVDTSRMTSSLWILKEDLKGTTPVNSKWVRLKTILLALALQNYKSWNFVRDLKLSFNWIRPSRPRGNRGEARPLIMLNTLA